MFLIFVFQFTKLCHVFKLCIANLQQVNIINFGRILIISDYWFSLCLSYCEITTIFRVDLVYHCWYFLLLYLLTISLITLIKTYLTLSNSLETSNFLIYDPQQTHSDPSS